MCQMPAEIDRLVYEGVLYMFEQESDMRVDDYSPFLRIRQWRREFMSGSHISTDVFFTLRQITQEPQYIFDAYMPGFQAGQSFMILQSSQVPYGTYASHTHCTPAPPAVCPPNPYPGPLHSHSATVRALHQETYTNFDEEAGQYAGFYFRLASEMVRQRRSYTSLFALFEKWGGTGAFLFIIFGLTARSWNAWHFNRQVRGLDIRKLDKGQFTPFGRLIDKSFQMPREYQCMSAD